jgi:uncharacterized protein YbbC (DUF1343 family)
LDGGRLAERVLIEGAVLRPVVFEPTFHKHAGRACGGVQVHVTDRHRFRSYEAYLRLIAQVARDYPDFAWRERAYEFEADRPAVDLLTGGPRFREAVDGGADLSDVLASERAGARRFQEERRPYLLYEGA